MKSHYIILNTYNPYKPAPLADKDKATRRFTKKEAEEYLALNNARQNLIAVEIKEKQLRVSRVWQKLPFKTPIIG